MNMETDNIPEDKCLEGDSLPINTDGITSNLQTMNQFDLDPLVEMQPMDQDLEQYQEAERDVEQTQELVQQSGVEIDKTVESEESVTANTQETQEPEIIIPEIEERPKPTTRTIAPKPVAPKIMGSSSGQPILLIQSPTTQSGQAIRLISGGNTSTTPGSYQLIKRADGVMQLRQAPAKVITSTTKKIAPAPTNKSIFTKVIVKGGGTNMMIGTPPTESTNAIKILPMTNTSGIKVTSPTKTITLAQAQNMGLIRTNATKMQVVPTLGKLGIKAPMKILPAPAHGITPIKTSINQNIVIKQTGLRPLAKQMLIAAKPSIGTTQKAVPTTLIRTVKPNVQVPIVKSVSSGLPSTQVIKIQTGQNAPSGQIHEINVPGRGVQYVRLVSNTSSSGSQNSKSGATFTTRAVLKTSPTCAKNLKSTIVSIRPAVSGTKTLIATQPSVMKTVTKSSVPIMSSTQASITSSSSNSPTSPTTSKTATHPKPIKPQPACMLIPTKSSSGNIMISPSQLAQIPGATLVPTNNHMQQLVVVPAHYMQQLQQKTNSQNEDIYESMMDVDVDDPMDDSTPRIGRPSLKLKHDIKRELSLENLTLVDKRVKDIVEANGLRPRKPCNCTRSQCLKLYCDCFANGEFCNMCNCKDCMNNIDNEEERQKAIRSCLDRNPSAFRPKIGKAKDPGLEAIRRHNKGCNCKRSGCLKNYCECFEAKIACSNNCKCVGCRNIEDCLERKRGWADEMDGLSNKKFASGDEDDPGWLGRDMGNNKWPINFITPDVIEATCQCLLAQADEAMKNGQNDEKVIDEILEEFGRCLVQIIQCFNKSNEGPSEEST